MKMIGARFLTGIVFFVFLSSLVLSLYHLASGMNMDGSMKDCPYMAHESMVCPMSFFDHVSTWQATFASAAPSVFMLIGLLFVAVAAVSLAPNLLVRARLWLLRTTVSRRRIITDSSVARPFQELFSNGILHPKLF